MDECWLWLAATDKDGYGIFHMRDESRQRGQRAIKAHRTAFYLMHGRWPFPMGLHGCDNPSCCNAVNPLHIHEGTASRNTREMHDRGRQPQHKGSGELNGNSKLTWNQVEEIRERYATGKIYQRQLAVEFNINQSLVSSIVRGKTWKTESGMIRP